MASATVKYRIEVEVELDAAAFKDMGLVENPNRPAWEQARDRLWSDLQIEVQNSLFDKPWVTTISSDPTIAVWTNQDGEGWRK